MHLERLELRDTGPFDDASIEFTSDAGVTLLTGRNGSGKSILLDAIRYWFGGQYGSVERALPRSSAPEGFSIRLRVTDGKDSREDEVTSRSHLRDTLAGAGTHPVWSEPLGVELYGRAPNFVCDHWCPNMAQGSTEVRALEVPDHRKVLSEALSGAYRRASATQLLCHVDYLRGSTDPREKRIGEALHGAVVRIVEASLLDGRYVGVDRLTLTPRIEQAGHVVPLGSISSGNAYLIHRMLGLLGRMYSVAMLRGSIPREDAVAPFRDVPGFLLIDEVENHLHPRWQKSVIPALRTLFPNVQVIATTHAPLVLSSVPGARVYQCRYDRDRRVCVARDETSAFASRSVEEILLSDAFDETLPWSDAVSALFHARMRAIEASDDDARRRAEEALVRINPEHFAYLRAAWEAGVVAGQHP